MFAHHISQCATSRLNPESYWFVNGSFLVTERFCKTYLFSVTSLCCTLVNPFVVMHPRVYQAHRLKSAGLMRQFANHL